MWHHTTVLVCLTQTVTCFDWLICSSAVGLADCLSVSEQLWQYCCSSFPPIEADAEITHMHWHTGSVGSWMFLLSSHRALPGRCFPWRRDGKAESEWTGSLYTCVCVCVCVQQGQLPAGTCVLRLVVLFICVLAGSGFLWTRVWVWPQKPGGVPGLKKQVYIRWKPANIGNCYTKWLRFQVHHVSIFWVSNFPPLLTLFFCLLP